MDASCRGWVMVGERRWDVTCRPSRFSPSSDRCREVGRRRARVSWIFQTLLSARRGVRRTQRFPDDNDDTSFAPGREASGSYVASNVMAPIIV